MCLLVVCSPDSTPKKKDLECGSCNNPHGFGYAIVAGDKIIVGKGMSAKKVIKEFLAVRKEHPKGYAMFHARYATHGVKNEDNCHPFKVGGDARTYLAHNGILSVDIHATDRRSDTRVFAEDTLPSMGGVSALDDDNVWKILSSWATGNKIAVLTVDPDADSSCYILNEGLGHWDNDGIWWSNTTYKQDGGWSTYITKTEPKDLLSEQDIGCLSCGVIPYEDANPYYCESCTACFDCRGMYGDTCQCWAPEWDKYKSKSLEEKSGAWYYDKHFDFGK